MLSRRWGRHHITQLSKSISQSKTHFSATHENQFTFLPLFSHASLCLSLSFSVSFLVSVVAAALFAVLLIVCFPSSPPPSPDPLSMCFLPSL